MLHLSLLARRILGVSRQRSSTEVCCADTRSVGARSVAGRVIGAMAATSHRNPVATERRVCLPAEVRVNRIKYLPSPCPVGLRGDSVSCDAPDPPGERDAADSIPFPANRTSVAGSNHAASPSCRGGRSSRSDSCTCGLSHSDRGHVCRSWGLHITAAVTQPRPREVRAPA
jgi:hypothetical protein